MKKLIGLAAFYLFAAMLCVAQDVQEQPKEDVLYGGKVHEFRLLRKGRSAIYCGMYAKTPNADGYTYLIELDRAAAEKAKKQYVLPTAATEDVARAAVLQSCSALVE